jgi:hypothetical protein
VVLTDHMDTSNTGMGGGEWWSFYGKIHIFITLNLGLAAKIDFKANFFQKLWKSDAPSKVLALSWQLLFNRIPSKKNLYTIWKSDAFMVTSLCVFSLH